MNELQKMTSVGIAMGTVASRIEAGTSEKEGKGEAPNLGTEFE